MGNLNKIMVGTVLVALLLSLPFDVFAQTIAKPPTPQEFTVQCGNDIIVKIKNIDYDLPTGLGIEYDIRVGAHWNDQFSDGTYSWRNAPLDNKHVQDPSGYTTLILFQPFYDYTDEQVVFEVRAVVCHYEFENVHSDFSPIRDIFSNVRKIDSVSDWSSPQSVALDKNGAIGVPTSVAPNPDPAQTPNSYPDHTQIPTPYPQYTQYPTASSNLWNNQLTALINYHWEKLALLVLAAIIVVLAAGLVLLWRKVGNLADQKHPQNSGT